MARPLVRIVLALSLLAAAGYGVWLYVYSRNHVWTDDAGVEGSVVVISARVPGPVARVLVRDNEEVREGQVLLEIDPRDYEIRVEQASAALAMAVASERAAQTDVPLTRDTAASRIQQARAAVEAVHVAVEVARAQVAEARARLEARGAAVAAARADAAVAEATLDKARRDLERMARLVAQGLVSLQDHETAQTAERTAAAALEATRRRLVQAQREAEQAAAEVRTRELGVAQAQRRVKEAEGLLAEAESQRAQVPMKEAGAGRAAASVQQAQADLAAAQLQLAKTRVRAPVDGVVSKKTVELGQLVQPGQPLLAIVPLHGIWVVANFKETQLARVRPGQRATVKVDTFPGRVFQGTVESISAGTGARFSLLPPENATGNWVKVVQRIPVKILLDGYHVNPHVLRPGMSATVTIDLR
ncbi:MAG: HlyD family secretion protein [Candidatus Rokubacteria bacterium]|nr:HlyD family secretion protein [Candidatus Rokubacteria bacterium]